MFEENSPRNDDFQHKEEEKKVSGLSAANEYMEEGLTSKQINAVRDREKKSKSSLAIHQGRLGTGLDATPDLTDGQTQIGMIS